MAYRDNSRLAALSSLFPAAALLLGSALMGQSAIGNEPTTEPPLLAEAMAAGSEAAGTELPVLVTAAIGTVEASELSALGWHVGQVVDLPVAVDPVSGGGRVRIRLPSVVPATLQIVSPRLVSAELTPGDAASKSTLEVALLPAATVRAEVIVPDGLELPRTMRFEARPCGAPDPESSLGTFPFRTEPGEASTARVPAGCIVAILLAEGFAPLELGTLETPAGGGRDLGRLRLQPAASLLVRCLSGADGLPVEGVEVFLVEPEAAATAIGRWLGSDGQETPAVARERRASTGRRGWVRFADLPDERYRALALAADGSLAHSNEIELRAGAEAVLHDLELVPPAMVEVAVMEPGAVPGGAGWQVLATGAAGREWLAETVLQRPVDDSGSATLGPLPPASWSFRLMLDDPERGRLEVDSRTVELEAGGFHRIELHASGTLFTGEVTWLGEPVEARLHFRSRREDSPGSTVVAARSREDGTFTVFLKEPGIYDVGVLEASAEGDAARPTLVPEVPLEDPEEQVEIELPGGVVSGHVVDEWGDPVAGGAILAQQARELGEMPLDTSTRSGPDGGFRLERLSPGLWTIRARTDVGQSESVRAELFEDEIRGGLLLTVREGTVLEGRSSASGRPVAGATVWVSCLWAGLGDLCGGVAPTGPDGGFSLDLGDAPEPARVNLVIDAPGLPLSAYAASASGAPIEIDLPTAGGRLTLVGATTLLNEFDASSLVLIDAAGGMVPAARGSVLEAERGSRVGALVFPNLAPGSWRLYRVRDLREAETLQRSGGAGMPPLAAFQLPPGGAIEVTVGTGDP